MEVSRPGGKVLYGGTYNGNHVVVAAAHACLEKLKTGQVQKHLRALSDQMAEGFARSVQEQGIAARMEHLGGKFQVFFSDRDITDYRSAYAADRERYRVFRESAVANGIWLNPGYLFHHGVTAAHTAGDVDTIVDAFDRALASSQKTPG